MFFFALVGAQVYFVDVPLIFFCPADHVLPDWQPVSILLGMVEARSHTIKARYVIGPQPYPVIYYVVANPVVRGLLNRKRSEEHLLQSSNESKKKHNETKQKRQKKKGVTKYTRQKKIDEGHSIERVWCKIMPAASHLIPSPDRNHAAPKCVYRIIILEYIIL